jgi:hypothetical protein
LYILGDELLACPSVGLPPYLSALRWVPCTTPRATGETSEPRPGWRGLPHHQIAEKHDVQHQAFLAFMALLGFLSTKILLHKLVSDKLLFGYIATRISKLPASKSKVAESKLQPVTRHFLPTRTRTRVLLAYSRRQFPGFRVDLSYLGNLSPQPTD